MKRSDLYFYLTNGSAGADKPRAAELVRVGTHAARLGWARRYMAAMGTANMVYWMPLGLAPGEQLLWDDYGNLDAESPYVRDCYSALIEHKAELPEGKLCIYLPSPWTSEAVREAVVSKSRIRLRAALGAVLNLFSPADMVALDNTSSWDREHVWALHEIAAMGFDVLIEGPARASHTHLLAFGCYVTADHLWNLDRGSIHTHPPEKSIGPVIVQHDGTPPDEDAEVVMGAWPGWGWAAMRIIDNMRSKKAGVQELHYALGVNEPRPDIALGLTKGPSGGKTSGATVTAGGGVNP